MARLKPVLFFAVVAVLAVLIVLRRPPSTIVNVGDPAPDFSIKDEAGNELTLSSLKGNVVFLNFWGTWCAPCRAEMPDMEAMNREFKDRKFKMVAVAVDTNWDDVKKFYQEHNLTMPTYLDPGRKVSLRYNVTQFPETYLIDGSGTVLKHYVGQQYWLKPQLMAYMDEVIQKEESTKVSSQ